MLWAAARLLRARIIVPRAGQVARFQTQARGGALSGLYRNADFDAPSGLRYFLGA